MPLDRPAKPGDPLRIPANTWNRLVRSNTQPKAPPRNFNGPNHSIVSVQSTFAKGIYNPVTIDATVLNVSSDYIDVLEYNPLYHYPHLWVADEVTDPLWVVLLEHLDENQTARALVNGLTWCLVDVVDLNHQYVTPNSSNDGLETTDTPTRAAIVSIPATTEGEHYILIHLGIGAGGSGSTRVATCGTAIPARSGATPGSGTASFLEYNDLTTTGSTFTCYNIFDKDVPANCPFLVHQEPGGEWLNERPAIIDLRLNGNEYQYRRSCAWETWITAVECVETSSGSV